MIRILIVLVLAGEPVDVETSVDAFFDGAASRWSAMRERLKKNKVSAAERAWLSDGKRRASKASMYARIDQAIETLQRHEWPGNTPDQLPWLESSRFKVGDVGQWPWLCRVSGVDDGGLFVSSYTTAGRVGVSFFVAGFDVTRPAVGREFTIKGRPVVVTGVRDVAGSPRVVIEPVPVVLLRAAERDLKTAKTAAERKSATERIEALKQRVEKLKVEPLK